MRLFILLVILFLNSCNSSEKDIRNLEQIESSGIILAYVYTDNGKMGLMDSNENVILPAQFDYIESWHVDNLIRIDSGGKNISGGDVVGYEFKKYGLINTQGKILFRPQFDDLIISNNSALVRVDSLFGYVDAKGNWIVKPKYKLATPFHKGTAVVQDNGHFALINKLEQKIIPEIFDEIGGFGNDVAVVQKDKKWGLLNYKGKYILPLDNYEGIGSYDWYYGKFKKKDKWFLIDTAGHIPIVEGFDEVHVREDEDSVIAVGKQGGRAVKIRLK